MWYKFHIYILKIWICQVQTFLYGRFDIVQSCSLQTGLDNLQLSYNFFLNLTDSDCQLRTLRIYYCVCIFFIGITWYYPASKVDTVWQFEHRYEFHADFYIVQILILFGYRPMWYILSDLFAALSTAISRITSQFL